MDSKFKLKDIKLIRIIMFIVQPKVLAFSAVLLLYSLIFWSVNKGISIDEGYYLLGYLDEQELGPNTTDFHRIVRTLFFFIPDENVLMFRWVRVVLTILLLILFLQTALRWLEMQFGRFINRGLYYSMGLLAGTMCFAYASPVIYYDNIQLMVYLLVFTLFFFSMTVRKRLQKYLSLLAAGFVMIFGVTNYPSSGILLIGIVLLLSGIYRLPSRKAVFYGWIAIITGLLLGAIVYSIFIYNLIDFFYDALWAYENSAKDPKAKYDVFGQWLVIKKYFLGMLKVYLPLLGIGVIYFLLTYYRVINRIILNIIFGLILLVIAYRFSTYFSNILILPALLLMADVFIKTITTKSNFSISKNLLVTILLIVLPLLAVIGSNQRLEMKMVYFMPFWALAYFILLAEYKQYLSAKRIPVWHTVFIIVFFMVFSVQGFLKHIHYNYSIKRSDQVVENAVRFSQIKVSDYQSRFYEHGINALNDAGFKAGDEVLAFYETFMLVYMSGGYVPHRLTYSAEFFVNNKDNIPPKKARFIIIDEYQVPMITSFLKDTEWGFPDAYDMVELGTDGQNLTELGYNYLLFVAKESQ